MHTDCILLSGLDLKSHACLGEGSVSKKGCIWKQFKCWTRCGGGLRIQSYVLKQARKVCSFLDTRLAKCFWLRPKCCRRFLQSCVLCPGPRGHLHFLLTRQTCLRPVGLLLWWEADLIAQWEKFGFFFFFLRLDFLL